MEETTGTKEVRRKIETAIKEMGLGVYENPESFSFEIGLDLNWNEKEAVKEAQYILETMQPELEQFEKMFGYNLKEDFEQFIAEILL